MTTQTPNNSFQAPTSSHSADDGSHSKPKRIKIWLNNESDCYKLLFDPRASKNWSFILDFVTKETKPRFGAIRKIICLSTNVPAHSFEELDPNEKYIAVGYNNKINLDKELYKTPSERILSLVKPAKRHYVGEFDSKILPFLKITKKHNLTLVYMVVNGIMEGPFKVVFKQADLDDWGLIKNYVTKVLGVNDGIQNICTVFGEPLHDAKELQHGCLYVAVPFYEKFKALDYMSLFGEENKSKLEPSFPDASLAARKGRPGKKRRPSSLSTDRKARMYKNDIKSDVDFYRDGEIQDSSEFSKKDTPECFTESLADREQNVIQPDDRSIMWPSSSKQTSYCRSYDVPNSIVLKKKRKRGISLITKRIRSLNKTIKEYEMRLSQLKEKREHDNDLDEEEAVNDLDDLFEPYHYKPF